MPNYRNFMQKHPYLHLMLVMVVASVIGITLEYLINRQFQHSGFYMVGLIMFFECIRIHRRVKKEKNCHKKMNEEE